MGYVEYTDEFETWWVGLDEEEQIDIDAVVSFLEEKGPHLPLKSFIAILNIPEISTSMDGEVFSP
jgi:hypothetical protein